MQLEQHADGILVTTDLQRIDGDRVEAFLRKSYWANTRTRERIDRSMQRSLCFGALHDDDLIAFARVVTDYADFAWLCDVYVDEPWRGKRVGHRLLEAVLSHPDLQGLRRWVLATRDAHSLYAEFGFMPLQDATRWMEIRSSG